MAEYFPALAVRVRLITYHQLAYETCRETHTPPNPEIIPPGAFL
ncbi:MAG TPA: hypothetical protein PLS58_12020 [Bacteroidales bacterium]|jgi:hypothetical protein|nr:hypothetical protein [Bacteroidales bacterium]